VSTVTVRLDGRSYDIVIGPALIDRVGDLSAGLLMSPRVIVVTDETVAPLYGARVYHAFKNAGIEATLAVMPAGEGSKSFDSFGQLMNGLLDQRPDRKTTLVALGGGVVGDLTGFAAATLLRGVDFLQIPTTLLAQVDSSVGGKTGINTRHGKNLIGAFYQPRLVLADTDSLSTLPRREVRAGYGEIVKYGLLGNAAFFEWLEAHGPALCDLEPAALTEAVLTSCRMKAEIVAEDERETGDQRALLNFGHTFGHALEAETGFGDALLHGEAVALGMVMAFDFAVMQGLATGQDAYRVRRHLAAAGLPTTLAEIELSADAADRLLGHMSKDKKVRDGRITLILPRRIGEAFVMRDASAESLRTYLAGLH